MSLFQKKSLSEGDLLDAPSPERNEMKGVIQKREAEKNLGMPKYQPVTLGQSEEKFEPVDITKEEDIFNEPAHPTSPSFSEGFHSKGESLFVKIEKYHGLLDVVSKIKQKLSHADKVIRELEDIKQQEERELKAWQENIASIKNKLVMIDEQLFKN